MPIEMEDVEFARFERLGERVEAGVGQECDLNEPAVDQRAEALTDLFHFPVEQRIRVRRSRRGVKTPIDPPG